ncbi:MAG TPA: T9SS type A sorting domain-containing protein [Candidatus Marinimicrobia bacterium]|nr:T9SS type A sorting domain-containing protein [Candidatus Neomarinimicrobiota bacterium]
MKLKFFNSVFIFILTILSVVNAQWVQTDGNMGRNTAVFSICMKDSIIFAGTDQGVYISKNNGENWTNSIPNYYNWSYVTVGPKFRSVVTDGDKIYAPLHYAYVSSDDGATWTSLSNTAHTLTEIGVEGRYVFAGHARGNVLYRSDDGGANWTAIDSIPGLGSIVTADSLVLIRTVGEIFRSTDYGYTWVKVLTLSPIWGLYGPIALHGDLVMAGLEEKIFYSYDKGKTWEADTIRLNCNAINAIVFNPPDLDLETDYIFTATDSGIFRSSDNGKTWQPRNNGLETKYIYSLAFKTVGTGGAPILFAGTGSGIYRSTDFGETWSVTGMPYGHSYLISTGEDLYAASSYKKYYSRTKYGSSSNDSIYHEIYHSPNGGASWIKADGGIETGKIGTSYHNHFYKINSLASIMDGLGNNHLFAAFRNTYSYQGGGIIYSSENDGESWAEVLSDYALSGRTTLQTLSSGAVFAGGSHGILRSMDYGATWDTVSINPVSIFASDNEIIYSGYGDLFTNYKLRPPETVSVNIIYESGDNGDTWTMVDSTISTDYDARPFIACIYAYDKYLIVGRCSSVNNEVPNTGLYYYERIDTGWVVMDSTFAKCEVVALTGIGSNVYAAAYGNGVYHSDNYGRTWSNISNGLLDTNVTSLVIQGDILFAATPSGVWKRPLSEISGHNFIRPDKGFPKKYKLTQNFPNPFNPTTTIRYQVPVTSYLTITVYDLLGREVVTIFDGVQQAGNYTAILDGSNLTSGIYFYRMEANGFTETKKLVLLK